jgi:hypothetical protein
VLSVPPLLAANLSLDIAFVVSGRVCSYHCYEHTLPFFINLSIEIMSLSVPAGIDINISNSKIASSKALIVLPR